MWGWGRGPFPSMSCQGTCFHSPEPTKHSKYRSMKLAPSVLTSELAIPSSSDPRQDGGRQLRVPGGGRAGLLARPPAATWPRVWAGLRQGRRDRVWRRLREVGAASIGLYGGLSMVTSGFDVWREGAAFSAPVTTSEAHARMLTHTSNKPIFLKGSTACAGRRSGSPRTAVSWGRPLQASSPLPRLPPAPVPLPVAPPPAPPVSVVPSCTAGAELVLVA